MNQAVLETPERAMGLVKAAHSSRKNSEGSETEAAELRQEYEARLAELATHGFQAVEHSGSLVFARALEEDGGYEAECLVVLHPRNTQYGEHPCIHPCAVIQLDSRLQLRSGTPARRMLRYKKVELTRIRVYTLWLTCEEGTNFCTVHSE
jgi:hypothetical protein